MTTEANEIFVRRLALLAFVVLQQARLDPSNTVGEVKRCLHLTALRGEQPTSDVSMESPARTQIMVAA